MAKDQRGIKLSERRVFISIFSNYATQLKLILFALLLLFTFAAFFQFLPAYFRPFSYLTTATTTTTTTISTSPPPIRQPHSNQVVQNGVVKRRFLLFGTAAYSFILMPAYRGGSNSFSIIGLSSKPLHVFSGTAYTCEFQSQNASQITKATKILPNWGFGRVYTVIVINCTFPDVSSASTAGGRLCQLLNRHGGGPKRAP